MNYSYRTYSFLSFSIDTCISIQPSKSPFALPWSGRDLSLCESRLTDGFGAKWQEVTSNWKRHNFAIEHRGGRKGCREIRRVCNESGG